MNPTLSALLVAASLGITSIALAADRPVDAAIADLGRGWAKVNYQMAEAEQDKAFSQLDERARQAARDFPGQAEPLIWQAIILSSHAKAVGGLGALSKVKEARELLLAAEKIDAGALNGSVYTTLGSLYAKVPGWPIGFGDKDKARACFEKALSLNPKGIDANYFYADFLAEQGESARAMEFLKAAQQAAPRPGREDADAGRRQDIAKLMANLRQKTGAAMAAN